MNLPNFGKTVHTCSRHNFTGLNQFCPDCENERAGGIASYEASDLEELRKEFYEKFTEPQFSLTEKILFQELPGKVWSWIEEKLKAR